MVDDNKFVWMKQSKGGACQISFLDSSGLWKCFFCPRSDVFKFLKGNFDMAKFTLVDNFKKDVDYSAVVKDSQGENNE